MELAAQQPTTKYAHVQCTKCIVSNWLLSGTPSDAHIWASVCTRAPRLRHVDFPNVVGLVTASRLFDGEAMACGLPETGKHKYPLARSSAGLFWFGVLRVFVYLICRYIDLRLGLLLLFVDSGR